ncbi:MAG: ATP-binding protein [Chitinophagaceae bacterium]
MDKAITFFYYFFHGILVFQVIIFMYLYKVSKKTELFYFGLFLLLLGINFILNSTDLYGMAAHDTFMYSPWYNLVNTPLVITANICYILFLKKFYQGLTKNKLLFTILSSVKKVLWGALIVFLILYLMGIISNLLFNILHLLGIIVGVWLVIIIYRDKLPFKKFIVSAFVSNLAGTFLTVFMLLLQNTDTRHIIVREYPYIFIQFGLLVEIFFFNLAILSKWTRLEREAAIFELKSELAMEKLRNQISKELHDDIGAELSGINLYSHIAALQSLSGKTIEAGRSLSVIQQASTKVVNRLKDIVWAINPVENELQSFSDKIEEFALYMCTPAGFTLKMVANTSPVIKLSAQYKHQFFLICKEAIANAVKYSNGTQIEMTIAYHGEEISIWIADNGRGFDIATVKRGNGINNMQKRADEIGAKLIFQSKENEGASICLQCKFTQ